MSCLHDEYFIERLYVWYVQYKHKWNRNRRGDRWEMLEKPETTMSSVTETKS